MSVIAYGFTADITGVWEILEDALFLNHNQNLKSFQFQFLTFVQYITDNRLFVVLRQRACNDAVYTDCLISKAKA